MGVLLFPLLSTRPPPLSSFTRHGAVFAAAPQVQRSLTLGQELASGNYGAVYEAQWSEGGSSTAAVAKCARAADGSQAALARAYLEVEAAVYESLERSRARGLLPQGFTRYFGRASAASTEWLVWERVERCGGVRRPLSLAELNHETGPEAGRDAVDEAVRPLHLATFGLSAHRVLCETLRMTHALHEEGFVHRDIKTANLLVSAPRGSADASLYLIDMGSCAQMGGCTLLDGWMGKCAGYDASHSPCSPLFAPPEQFIDPQHPFAFDVYSIAITFLRLSWPSLLRTDAQLRTFRRRLAAAGTFEEWLRRELSATAVSPSVAEALEVFPGSEVDPLQAAMLRTDPGRRPPVSSLLVHPFVSSTPPASSELKQSDMQPSVALELSQLLGAEGCVLPVLEVEERHLSISVELQKPLGILLGEDDAPTASVLRVAVDELLEGGSAMACGELQVGDRLVSVDGIPVRGAPLSQVMGLIERARSKVALLFERDCKEECPVPAAELLLPPEQRRATERPLPSFVTNKVVETGVACSQGKRETQEDTHVLTMFTMRTPRDDTECKCLLAAVFDGHRGPRASAYASTALPSAVRAALERHEPAPLGAAWRDVCEGYLSSGAQDGCTATAVLIHDDASCEVLNVGDSRTAVAHVKWGTADVVFATRDHSAADAVEIDRITAAGGEVSCANGQWRVKVESPAGSWLVAVARSLGGSEWRGARISDVADVHTMDLEGLDGGFIVLASDGVWGALDSAGTTSAQRSEAVVNFIFREAHIHRKSASEIAQDLNQRAYRAGSTDNACSIVLFL
ncbi:hypothetical protein AB1Y20_014622 [Prymnesium parvum]|uniref:Protein-serine/threonine phosphatase n=1 Tax=Prymnesium parvum TaxID=97485 RepID=A0AB34IBY7_PRYPA